MSLWVVLVVLYVKKARVIFEQSNMGNHKSRTHKTSLMFMKISVLYIVTFLPRMFTSIVTGVKADFWDTRLHICILHLLFIVNHLAKPFVYAFMNVKFWTDFMYNRQSGHIQQSSDSQFVNRTCTVRTRKRTGPHYALRVPWGHGIEEVLRTPCASREDTG